jgi:hypothetical protein
MPRVTYRTGQCLHCKVVRRIEGRGLCSPCYRLPRIRDQYERKARSPFNDGFVEEPTTPASRVCPFAPGSEGVPDDEAIPRRRAG